jgi:hypothetical protein
MKNLQEATEMICDLKGSQLALGALVTTLLQQLPAPQRATLLHTFSEHTEIARAMLLNAPISDHVLSAFERDVRQMVSLLAGTSIAVTAAAALLTSP